MSPVIKLAAAALGIVLLGCGQYVAAPGARGTGEPDRKGGSGGSGGSDGAGDRGGTGGTGGNGAEGGDTGLPGGTTGALLFGEEPDGSLTAYRVNDDGTLTEVGSFR